MTGCYTSNIGSGVGVFALSDVLVDRCRWPLPTFVRVPENKKTLCTPTPLDLDVFGWTKCSPEAHRWITNEKSGGHRNFFCGRLMK